jgi:hypothetical protein
MSFTTNIQITKSTPAVLYDATETAGVWHEDHEISGAQYRAANATFIESTGMWKLVNPSQPAYATVQNTDGSTIYLYMPADSNPWATSAWQGAGQPTSYYAVNYGMTESDTTGSINTPALEAAIAAVIADPGETGGTLHLPAGTFFLNDTIVISGQSGKGLIIKGASGGTTLVQNAGQDVFQINTWTEGPGVRFEDLYLSYAKGMGQTGNTAVNVNATVNHGAENVTCERVYFSNCPTAFATGGASLQCGLLDCTIDYELGPDGQVAVSLNGSENFVHGCVIRQPGGDSPSGGTGILLNGPVACFVTDSHISDFSIGIMVAAGTYEAFLSNLRVDAYTTAVVIEPATDSGTIYDIHFSNCTLALANGSMAQSSGFTIGTGGGGNSNVAGIFLDHCSVLGFANAGLEIDSGENIVVTGGQYSSNGQNPSSTPFIGAGIAIIGGTKIIVSGANCTGISYLWQNQIDTGTPTTQPYGITINQISSYVTLVGCDVTGNATSGIVVANEADLFPSDIFIRGCNAAGYSKYGVAIDVKGGEVSVQVTDCAGYNDQGSLAVLSTGAPPSGAFSNVTFGYYGPIAFYAAPSTSGVPLTITVDTVVTGLAFGGFTLGPGETAAITGTPAQFLVVGK